MKVGICGISGKMGSIVLKTAIEQGHEVTFGVDPCPTECGIPIYGSFCDGMPYADCIIDFSDKKAIDGLLAFATARSTPCVIATTDFGEAEKDAICAAAHRIPIYLSSNYSVGIAAVEVALRDILRSGFRETDVEIIEYHHKNKKDAPSGTALRLAQVVHEETGGNISMFRHPDMPRNDNEICLHAVRGGSLPGKHEVLLFTPDETITITHEAHSKRIFALGALKAAEFLIAKEKGLYSGSPYRDI